MKITCLQSKLKQELNIVNHFTSSKAQLPVLGSVLLKASKGKLTLSATNLENSISTVIGAKIDEDGEIAIPSKTFFDLISNLKSENVEILTDKDQVKIVSGSFKSVLSGISSSDFPKIPDSVNEKDCLNIDFAQFKNCLNKCIYACSVDDTRPILSGVLFEIDNSVISFVATDGFRLSKITLKTEIKMTKPITFVVPRNFLNEILKSDIPTPFVSFYFDQKDNQVIFRIAERIFSSRTIAGSFPEYQKIIPGNPTLVINLDKNDLMDAIKLSGVFARESGNIVNLIVKKNILSILSESKLSGSQENKIEISTEGDLEDLDKKPFEISYNFRFIEDFLKSVESDNVSIEIANPEKAGKFLEFQNSKYLHLIMPIRNN